MKRTFYTLGLLFAVLLSVHAAPVDKSKAAGIAKDCLNARLSNAKTRSAVKATELKLVATRTAAIAGTGVSEYPLYYVFSPSDGQGFVIVSGDDRIKSVIGYSDTASFDTDGGNQNLKWWLDAVAEKTRMVAEGTAEAPVRAATRSTAEAVEPLIQTKWAQSSPYYKLCPQDNTHGGRSLTGCVATAMAQVLKYYQYPEKGTGEVSYKTTTHGFSVTCNLSKMTFKYDKMTDSYSSSSSEEANNAVAELMYACGAAVNMDYCAYSSGAFLTASALSNYFGFDKSCASASRALYTTAEWEALIINELTNSRPIFYQGTSANDGSHEFICDGYDGNGLFHINWGWGGQSDGYYDLSLLDCSSPGSNYTYSQEILYNVKPDEGGETTPMSEDLTFDNLYTTEELPATVKAGKTFSCYATNVRALGNDFDGVVGIGLYKDGECVAQSLQDLKLSSRYYYPSITFTLTIPSRLSGDYTLNVVAGSSETDFKPIKGDLSSGGVTYFNVSVSSNTATITKPDTNSPALTLVGDAVTDGGSLYVGYDNTISFSVKNSGGDFNGEIFIGSSTSNKTLFNDYYVIDAGTTKTLKANINTSTAGEQSLEVYYRDTESNTKVTIGTLNINAVAPAEGTPVLTITGVEAVTPDIKYGETAQIRITLSNAGGFFNDYICWYLYTLDNSDDWTRVKDYWEYTKIKINKGEEKSFIIEPDYAPYIDADASKTVFCLGSWYYYTNSWTTMSCNDWPTITVTSQSTGISTVTADDSQSPIYTITGINAGHDVNKLSKGIYIKNGKKFIVK